MPNTADARAEELVESSPVANSRPTPRTRGPIVSSLPTEDPAFREIVQKFLERLPQRLEEMCDALEAENFAELAQLGHWLKGAAGTVGFGGFTEPSRSLETQSQQRDRRGCEAVLGELIEMAAAIEFEGEADTDSTVLLSSP